jgi:Fic family protein
LVSIHPFGDGNGRISRLLMNYILAYFDLPLTIVFKEDRIKYIDALEASRNNEQITIFFKFMFAQYKKFIKKELKILKSV